MIVSDAGMHKWLYCGPEVLVVGVWYALALMGLTSQRCLIKAKVQISLGVFAFQSETSPELANAWLVIQA